MRVLAAAVLGILLLASPGCIVVSLHPAYDDRTVGFDEGLVGTWKSDDDQATVEFARGEWRSYRVTVKTDRDTTTVSAHVTNIGTVEMLDVMPPAGIDLATLSIAVHVVYRVELSSETLTLSALDFEPARRAMPNKLGVPAVFDERQNVVITAGTADLRKWLGKTGGGGPPFASPTTFHRVVGQP